MSILASPFNLGGPDGLIIFILILLLFGAKRLPELARGLGSAVREFSKAKDEIEHEITRPNPPSRQIEPPRGTEQHLASSTHDEMHDNPYHQETYPDHAAPAPAAEVKTPEQPVRTDAGSATGGASTPV